MNKRIPFYYYIVFTIAAGTLFLPYVQQAFGVDSVLLPEYAQQIQVETGLDHIETTFAPVLAILVISIIVLSYKNTTTAIAGAVLSILPIIYLVYIETELTFTVFGLTYNKMAYGYYIALVNAVAFCILNIVQLVWIRKNKSISYRTARETHILDSQDVLNNN